MLRLACLGVLLCSHNVLPKRLQEASPGHVKARSAFFFRQEEASLNKLRQAGKFDHIEAVYTVRGSFYASAMALGGCLLALGITILYLFQQIKWYKSIIYFVLQLVITLTVMFFVVDYAFYWIDRFFHRSLVVLTDRGIVFVHFKNTISDFRTYEELEMAIHAPKHYIRKRDFVEIIGPHGRTWKITAAQCGAPWALYDLHARILRKQGTRTDRG